jgi:hypothetical protein
MRTRTWGVALAIAGVIASGCGKAKDRPRVSAEDPADQVAPAVPAPKIAGPSITPTITSSITFVAPKTATTWAEMSFPCYRAAIELQPGGSASDAFYKVSPLFEPALRAADIDLDRDVAAIGGWSCGEGPCFYLALTMRHPERVPDMLRVIPNVTPREVGPGHYTFDAPGPKGTRAIHVQVVPIQWGAALPTDAWSQEMAKATHVMFVGGLFGTGGSFDPLAAIADPRAAPARVADAEGLLADRRERCVVGTIGPNAFKPGFQLERARFAMGAPSGAGDPLTRLIGSTRSLAIEVELTVSPAPTAADVTRWIDEARAWVATTADPIRAQLAGNGPIVDAYFDMFRLIATRGFTHRVDGKSIVLSWRTDRIGEGDIAAVNHELEAATGTTIP